jgi:DNA polymerase III gamma/tau subunit
MTATLLSRYVPVHFSEFGEKGNLVQTLIDIDSLHLLLVGGPGTGKTSLCNLILKHYYKNTVDPANLLYINNVKEQGVQFYRTEVRVFCQTTSSIPGKKKTIILDDMDLISEQGQQVFLTGLDLYGHSVNYVATCRCQQNLIESIHSRLISIQLKNFTTSYLEHLLMSIAEKENVAIELDALKLCAVRCNGSVRTLINYVEKFKLLNDAVTVDVASACCSNIQESFLNDLLDRMVKHDLKGALRIIHSVSMDGYSVMDILDSFFVFVKHQSLSDEIKFKMIKVISKYVCVLNQIHEHSVELLFFVNELVDVLR